jgi:hypothetical protein
MKFLHANELTDTLSDFLNVLENEEYHLLGYNTV